MSYQEGDDNFQADCDAFREALDLKNEIDPQIAALNDVLLSGRALGDEEWRLWHDLKKLRLSVKDEMAEIRVRMKAAGYHIDELVRTTHDTAA